MTLDDLIAWLEDVEKEAREEGERWRALRLPGDLKLDAYTDDRGRLHLVGEGLEHLEKLARSTRDLAAGLKPKPTGVRPGAVRPSCTGFLRVGCGEEFPPPEVAKCTPASLCAGCKVRKEERAAGPKCCDHAGEYSGMGSDGPLAPWYREKGCFCACHD